MKNDVRAAIAENPVLVLFLGSCPAMVASTSVISALGMGAAVLVVIFAVEYAHICPAQCDSQERPPERKYPHHNRSCFRSSDAYECGWR